MLIKCPECGFSRKVDEAKLPARAEMATCPKCKKKFRFRTLSGQSEQVRAASSDTGQSAEEFQSEHKVAVSPSPTKGTSGSDIWQDLDRLSDADRPGESRDRSGQGEEAGTPPWERLDIHGFFQGLFKTVKQVMFSPKVFFSRMPVGEGLAKPLVFYLLLAELVAIAQFLLQMAGVAPMLPEGSAGMAGFGIMGMSAVLMLVVYPLILTCMLFVGAAVAHLCLVLVRASSRGFEGTFRAMTYGSAPMILGIIPFFGALVGGVWALVTTFIGYMGVHETSAMRVLLAMLLPLLVVIVLTALAVALL